MTSSPSAGAATRVTWLWWVSLVLAARRLSTGLATILADGLYLVAWPGLAAVASPLALLLGGALGATHPGYDLAFSESVPLLLLIVVLGTFSGHLGLLFLAGYALGDFFLFDRQGQLLLIRVRAVDPSLALLQNLTRVRVPLLIQYGLMALPLVAYPVMTKSLLRTMTFLTRLGEQGAFVASAVLHGAITFALVYFWTQSVPLLIRPLYTWRGASVEAAAVVPVQQLGPALAAAAVVASVVRLALQGMTAYLPRFRQPLDAAEARFQEAEAAGGVTPLTDRLPAALAALGRALATALLLGGIYQSWAEGIALFLLLVVIEGARARVLPVPLGPWPDLMERVPILIRLGGATLLIIYLGSTLAAAVRSAPTFRPLVLLSGLAILVYFLVNPVSPRARPEPSA
jgi:hypothetical protein